MKFFSNIFNLIFGYSIVIDKYEYEALKRKDSEIETITKSRDSWQQLAEDNLKGWNGLYNEYDKALTGWGNAVTIGNTMKENSDRCLALAEKQMDLINRYDKSNVSLMKTIDSLVGELIMRGVSEDEIAEMFEKKDGDNSYAAVMWELNEVRKNESKGTQV